jgi:hypothetical protein
MVAQHTRCAHDVTAIAIALASAITIVPQPLPTLPQPL